MKPHDMQPHASPGGSRRRRPPVIATRRMVALTGGLCASPGGMVLIRHLSAGSAGSASTVQPPSGNFGGGANTMQYDYSGSYSVSLTVGEDSTAVIDGTDITASSSGSNGVFATDSGTALVNDTSIETMADNSRGLDATYGGTILANKITADTQGGHSAIVATDRGGGSISLADATLSTAGSGSPLLYSTGDIQVNNVSGTSSGSQIAGMEGLNTILIKDSTLESTVTGKTASDPIATASSSTSPPRATRKPAPASTPRSSRSIPHSAPPIGSGSMFYFTNTTADVVLQNTELDFDTGAATVTDNASGNDSNNWGSTGSNGATVNFTGRYQTLAGGVTADTISSVGLYLLEGAAWTGAATVTDNAAAGSGTGTASDVPITVNVDGTSTWVVAKDTTISALNVASGGGDGNTVTIVANGKTVVFGSGDVTVTVTGSY